MSVFSRMLQAFRGERGNPAAERQTWERAREERLEMSGNRCEMCNSDAAPLHAHHRRYSGRAAASDIIILCKGCHAVFTAYKRGIDAEGHRAVVAGERRAARPPEQKPAEFLAQKYGLEAKWFRRFSLLETPARQEWRGNRRIYSVVLSVCQELGMVVRLPNGGARWDEKYAQSDRYVSILMLSSQPDMGAPE